MRLLVISDSIGALSSGRAGELLAAGWAGASVQVVAAGQSGQGFLSAYAMAHDASVRVEIRPDALVESFRSGELAAVAVSAAPPADVPVSTDGLSGSVISIEQTSRPLGEAIARVLEAGPVGRLVVDLSGSGGHDGGAGLLAALGASADRPLDRGVSALAEITRLDLTAVRERLAGAELIGVVPDDQLDQRLLGLRGITSLRGRAADWAPELMLSVDSRLEAYAKLAASQQPDRPGAGACGGLGFAIQALGGRLTTGPELALESVSVTGWDLVVTGCSVFDFRTRGGGVVSAAARRAGESLSPCIAIAGEVLVGAREMRTMGIEAAYAVHASDLDRPVGHVTADELAATATRVARSWHW